MKIISKAGGLKIITFGDAEYKSLVAAWKNNKKNPNEEELKTLKDAAAIIRNDNKLFVSTKISYPPSNNILDNIDQEIPPKLNYFLQQIILHEKRYNLEKYEKKKNQCHMPCYIICRSPANFFFYITSCSCCNVA